MVSLIDRAKSSATITAVCCSTEWLNLGPINEGLPQYNVTYTRISAFDASVRAVGLNSLSYFGAY